MYISVLLSVLVYFNYLFTNANAEDIYLNVTVAPLSNLSLPQGAADVHLTITDITYDFHSNGTCTGWCHHEKENISSPCSLLPGLVPGRDGIIPYIIANITKTWNKNDNGLWNCYFHGNNKENHDEGNAYVEKLSRSFMAQVQEPGEGGNNNWIYIVVGVLVIVIIVGQTICIIHFKKKAKAVSRHANLTPKGSQVIDDIARYSSLPAQKQIETSKDARESGIYEVLENIRGAPEPPSVNTLPGWSQGQKSSSIDRIKDRPPLPIPPEEVYEVVDPSPVPPRKMFNRSDVPQQLPPRKNVTGYSTHPRKPRTPLMERGTTAQTLRPQMQNSLKLALEIRKRANTEQAPPERVVVPFNPGLPPPSIPGSSGSLANMDQGAPKRVFSPFHPGLPPSPATSRQLTASPALKKRPIPPPQSAATQRFPLPRFAAPGLKPHLPPGERPSPGAGPKWRPPPPVKPKQLHPLPALPPEASCQSQAMPINRGRGNESPDEDDDQEWVYEPLPQYNIYSV